MPGGEPQSVEIKHAPVCIPDAQIATGKIIPLIIAPPGQDEQLELISIEVDTAVLGTTVPFDIVYSTGATPTDTTLASAVSAVTGRTAKVPFNAFRGSKVLGDNDAVRLVFGTVTAGSVSGMTVQPTYRVIRHS